MTRLLAIDIGTSSVKAAVLVGGSVRGGVERATFATDLSGDRAEVPAGRIIDAIARAVSALDRRRVASVDAIAPSTMGPSWLAIDRAGRPLTPIVTHQDRRSIAQARRLEQQVGAERHLRIVGSRPIPGGISSTTCAWYAQHHRGIIRRARLFGHLPTLLHIAWGGRFAGAIDPGHASFTGLFQTFGLPRLDWSGELCEAIGISGETLPRLRWAGEVAGVVSRSAASEFGFRVGTPILTGVLDGSVPLLAAGLRDGRLVNVVGSTDVLMLCVGQSKTGFAPRADPGLLTRAVGIRGQWWVQAATLASLGSSLHWAKQNLFPDLSDSDFALTLRRAAREAIARPCGTQDSVVFQPWLSGDRLDIVQRTAAFTGLRLGTGRFEMLAAMLRSLADAGAARMHALLAARRGRPVLRRVLISGGVDPAVTAVLRKRWPPGSWRFETMRRATLTGLGALVDSGRSPPHPRGL